MKQYEWLLLDVDDTITDNTRSVEGGYRKVCKVMQLPYEEERFEQFIAFDCNFWREWESGNISLPKDIPEGNKINWLRTRRFIHHFEGIDFNTAVRLNEIYSISLADKVYPIEGAIPFIEYVSSHYHLAVASNTPLSSVGQKLEKAGVLPYFDHVVVAEEFGIGKQDPEFFSLLMERIGFHHTNQIAIIGDSLTSDILGASRAGIDTYWYNKEGKKLPKNISCTMQFQSFDELYSIF